MKNYISSLLEIFLSGFLASVESLFLHLTACFSLFHTVTINTRIPHAYSNTHKYVAVLSCSSLIGKDYFYNKPSCCKKPNYCNIYRCHVVSQLYMQEQFMRLPFLSAEYCQWEVCRNIVVTLVSILTQPVGLPYSWGSKLQVCLQRENLVCL